MDLPDWARWFDVDYAPDGHAVRYRVFYGGRGGGKSWAAAAKLVERGWRKPTRILCAREHQNSTRDSSKRLIEDTIDRMELGPKGSKLFQFSENEIRGQNGTLFSFIGLDRREDAIKSLEGYHLSWIEEAASISQSSLDSLIPTIRQEGSELWFTYNPRQPTDPVDRFFRGEDGPPPGTVCFKVGWRDNRWLPGVLASGRAFDEQRDPDKHAHIWEGEYDYRSEARVFENWRELPFETPYDALLLFGADWGYSRDPTVLIRCFQGRWSGEPGQSSIIADPNGECLFIDQEAYALRCEIDDLPALFAGSDHRIPSRWPNHHAFRGIKGSTAYPIRADCSRPDTISHLARRGFNIVAAAKGPASIMEGISFLRSYDIYVHPRCTHVLDELRRYRWKTDRQTGQFLSEPIDKHNHLIDALRYAAEGIRRPGQTDYTGYSAGRRTMIPGFNEPRAFSASFTPYDYIADRLHASSPNASPLYRRGLPY